MRNTVVAHFRDGRILKGVANDFAPARPSFHLAEKDGGGVVDIRVEDLKAVFFVKSYGGHVQHHDDPNAERTGYGKRILVRFRDGETIVGYTSGYAPDRPAFFLFPADERSNNEKVFVVVSSTTAIDFV